MLRLENSVFLKKVLYIYSYSFWKDLSREYVDVLKFLSEVPNFVLIYVITVMEVHGILLTSNSHTCGIVSKMNFKVQG